MQTRLVELIEQLPSDEITAELLRINDDLNNIFLRYGRWEKNREAGGGQQSQMSASAVMARAMAPAMAGVGAAGMKEKSLMDDSLIDLGGDDTLPDQLAKMSKWF